ncbi:hypothetical protein MIR68_000481 [Amoeboaphelidium protococcarum]|nr:hypothetical protein MIR68_000481 [Amoeboaphelidium protococcarum]
MAQNTIEHGRDPCPWRILDDLGGAFALGAIGGGIWHGVKGAKNSPKGERFLGALSAVKSRAPVLGCNFAVWGGMFSAFDCSLAYMRRKEDPWNSILSGTLTGGCLAIRGGPKTALTAAVVGGTFLAVIEGAMILISRMATESMRPPPQQKIEAIPSIPVAPTSKSEQAPSSFVTDDAAEQHDSL